MEQLINAATMPYWATIILFILGGAFIGAAIFIFVIEHGNLKEEVKTIIALLVLGVILLASGVHYKNIYSKNNNQAKSIAKTVIAEEYPDATEFFWNLNIGSFIDNSVEYKIKYQKTVNNKEKLIVTVKKGQSENKNAKTLDIPREKSK